MRAARGFTLVELVITIALSTIVISFMSVFISGPVNAYNDQTRRMELVDLADMSLRRVSRDVRRALPNSVRVRSNGSVVALEVLSTVDGARYRDRPPGSQSQRLRFNNSDDAFNAIGGFNNIAKPFSSTTHFLAIYNVGVPGANAYELANVITPAGTQIDIDADTAAGEDNVRLSPAFRFAYTSPGKRVFLVDGPVSYLCDTATGTLNRYAGYSINANHALRDSSAELVAAGASATTLATDVAACSMSYAPGTSQRAGLLTMALTISEAGESVDLLHQVHVDNVP